MDPFSGWSFVFGFFHLACFQVPYMLYFAFLQLDNIPLHGYTILGLAIHP